MNLRQETEYGRIEWKGTFSAIQGVLLPIQFVHVRDVFKPQNSRPRIAQITRIKAGRSPTIRAICVICD